MKFRATEEEIYEQVVKDTYEVEAKMRGWENKPIISAVDRSTITNSLRRAIGDRPFPMAQSIGEMKEAASVAETEDDWLLFIKHWLGRLVTLKEGVLYEHRYDLAGYRDSITGRRLKRINLGVFVVDGQLWISLCTIDEHRDTLHKLEMKGKPSRVLAKIFGESLITHMCQHYPIKGSKLELHFSKSYIPELYSMLARDEDMGSCMSKDSSDYDLPDHYHPTMPYEQSSNAVLALLYNVDKKRYVARTIAGLEIDESGVINYNTTYGTAGCEDSFQAAGLVHLCQMDGLELSIIETGEGTLLPYVDSDSQYVRREGSVFVVDHSGDISGSYESGRTVDTFNCSSCEEDTTGDRHETEDGDVCECCIDEYAELERGDVVHIDRTVYLEYEGVRVREGDAVYCEYMDLWYRDSEVMVDVVVAGGNYGRNHSTIALRNLADYMEYNEVVSIDGQEPNTYLGIEPELEEEAA